MSDNDDRPAQPEWVTCEHWWVYTSQPDSPFMVGRCGLCGYYNGPDLQEQLDEAIRRAVVGGTATPADQPERESDPRAVLRLVNQAWAQRFKLTHVKFERAMLDALAGRPAPADQGEKP